MDQTVTITTRTEARIRGGDNADILVEFDPEATDRSVVVKITQDDDRTIYLSRSEATALLLSLDGLLDNGDEDEE